MEDRNDAPSLRESAAAVDAPTFATQLKTARAAARLTQAAAARAAGLNTTLVAHYEGGDRTPSLTNLRRLARALDVSADYLVGLSPERVSAATAAPLRLCSYCSAWHSKPCGEGCCFSLRDPTWEQHCESARKDGASPHNPEAQSHG